jgi:hypothetical protein
MTLANLLADGKGVAGEAKFEFTQFSVQDNTFKIGYSQAAGISLKSVDQLLGQHPLALHPAGQHQAHPWPWRGLGGGVGSVSLLALDATVTLTIKPSFSLQASAGAKVIGIQVASVGSVCEQPGLLAQGHPDGEHHQGQP